MDLNAVAKELREWNAEAYEYVESNLRDAEDQIDSFETAADCYWAYYDNAFDSAPSDCRFLDNDQHAEAEWFFRLKWLALTGEKIEDVHYFKEAKEAEDNDAV